ncbi:MAG: hypothetical protein J7K53_12435 [Bacteroidales bacterium]|nr:hypothetical protein [Bacteroidales bacterium]
MKSKSIGFIGGERITKIFLQALANKQIELSSVQVCDTNSEVLNTLKKQFPKIQMTDSCELLKTLGETFEVEESKLEASAMVSAMLPTHFWFQWEAMQKLGVQMGLFQKINP